MTDMYRQLKKRSQVDVALMAVLGGVLALYGAYQLVMFARTDMVNTELLVGGIATVSGALIAGLVVNIFLTAYRSHQPFGRAIIVQLRLLGVFVATTAFVPHFIAAIIMFPRNYEYTFVLNAWNLLIFLVGLVIAMLSEVFAYGQRLQEDVDSIA